MTADPLQAWLIHKTQTGDTSLRLRFFTREQGILDCYYRLARNSKKNILLQPFTPLWLLTQERNHWFYVKSLENSGLSLTLSGSALFSALYINELLFYVVSAQEQDEPLFTSYENALMALETAKNPTSIEPILRRFEKALLSACGYGLSWLTEGNGQEPIKPNAYYALAPREGFRQTTQGLPGYHILAIAKDQLEDPEVLKTAKRIMRLAIDKLLEGRVLKSRSLYIPKA